MKTVVILGNGFDKDLGIDLSFNAYCANQYCIAYKSDKKSWGNFENDIREKILEWEKENSEEMEKEINAEWTAFKKQFSYFFTHVVSKAKNNINHSSYAYNMLQNFTDRSSVYTFNYTYPYEYVELDNKKYFIFVHGRYYRDSFYDSHLTMSQSPQMIVGIDCRRIPSLVKESPHLSPIIKRLNSHFVASDIEDNLLYAEEVVFFGFSMSITDADYFDKFFSAIISGEAKCKTLFYITLNEANFDNLQSNIEKMGYEYQTINNLINIIPLYTEERFRTQSERTYNHILSII